MVWKKYFNKVITGGFAKNSDKMKVKSIDSRNNNFFDHFSSNDSDYVSSDSYCSNPIINRCVNLVTSAASHVPFEIYRKNNQNQLILCAKHPANMLLKQPSPGVAGADFFTEIIANLLLYGNSYVLNVSSSDHQPQVLRILHPKKIDIIARRNIPSMYKYINGEEVEHYTVHPISRMSRVMHIKNYHPNNDFYGVSCLASATKAVSLHDQTISWNKSLLKYSIRPSGALTFQNGNGYLSDEQFERLKEQFYENFSGSTNSGKPLILEGGLQWQESSATEKLEKFLELKDSMARDIAIAFNVPPQLLGINGDNTYSNMQEARLALWEENIIPLLDKLSDNFSNWLSYWYKEDIKISFNINSISALAQKRERLWEKLNTADFMTINEKRALVGLPSIPDCDKLG
jgi:HK97 family phage portal protein